MKNQLSKNINFYTRNFIHNARIDLNYSLAEASRLININESLLKDYETGKQPIPSYMLLRIMNLYNSDSNEFFKKLDEILQY